MGLDIHAFRFLMEKSREKNFDSTITIGRQNCHLGLKHLKRVGWSKNYVPKYIEEICIELFGSSPNVFSIDNSNYENASIIQNLNAPFDHEVGKFDTILDLGTLEHVFDVKQSMQNINKLVKKNGRIFHVSPTNNFSGHGFYQFSPELFFSLYSEENGYSETEVYLKKLDSSNSYFKVKKPQDGKRFQFYSFYPVYILVSTKKNFEAELYDVHQSDYVHLWTNQNQESDKELNGKDQKKSFEPLWDKWPIKYFYRTYILTKNSLTRLNSNLKKIKF